jgi:hypothetical protein
MTSASRPPAARSTQPAQPSQAPPSSIKRWAWLAIVVLVGAGLVIAAWLSPDRQMRIVADEATGPMSAIAMEQVREVQVDAPGRPWRLRRDGAGWAGQGPLDTTQVEQALRLLRHSAPERTLETESPDFGLAAPALRLRVYAGAGTEPAFEVAFGARNPIGLAHYARVQHAGTTQLMLLPAYVAETWLALGAPK